jgi:hypothetical protein
MVSAKKKIRLSAAAHQRRRSPLIGRCSTMIARLLAFAAVVHCAIAYCPVSQPHHAITIIFIRCMKKRSPCKRGTRIPQTAAFWAAAGGFS